MQRVHTAAHRPVASLQSSTRHAGQFSRPRRLTSGPPHHSSLPQQQSRDTLTCEASLAASQPCELLENGADDSQKSLALIFRVLSLLATATLSVGLATSLGNAALFASVTHAGTGLGSNLSISSASAGMAAGFLHTLCGPDHLAALTPLTINRNRFAAALLGSLWGLGHSTGQVIIGVAFSLLKEQFTALVPFLAEWAGRIVALTLIGIGAHGIYESFFEGEEEEHDDEAKLREITGVASGKMQSAIGGNSLTAVTAARMLQVKPDGKVAWATFATGILYGLQPDALFVVLPALALPPLAGFSYCVMFVIGTVLAMGGYTFFIGTASQQLCKDRPWLQRNLSVIASGIAILVGVLLLLSCVGFDVPLFN